MDGFQGREKEVILFSAVISRRLGFVSDARRVNVALTRAKCSLLVVGHMHTLHRGEVASDDLLRSMEQRKMNNTR